MEVEHTFTPVNHPRSNGKLERFHRTLKTEHVRRAAYVSYEDARIRLAERGEKPHTASIQQTGLSAAANCRSLTRLMSLPEKRQVRLGHYNICILD
jgi:transposase InsO family protein